MPNILWRHICYRPICMYQFQNTVAKAFSHKIYKFIKRKLVIGISEKFDTKLKKESVYLNYFFVSDLFFNNPFMLISNNLHIIWIFSIIVYLFCCWYFYMHYLVHSIQINLRTIEVSQKKKTLKKLKLKLAKSYRKVVTYISTFM